MYDTNPRRASQPSRNTAPAPLYAHVRESLRREISTLSPGDLLAGDAELGDRFGVSRVTIRRALSELVAEGLIVRERGRGTFVRDEPIAQEIYHPAGWAAAMRSGGHEPTTLAYELEVIEPDAALRSSLRMPRGRKAYRVRRIRGVGAEPISIITNYLARAILPRLARTGLVGDSMNATLAAASITTARVDETVEARAATASEAAALHVEPGSPLLVVSSTTFDPAQKPVLMSIAASRGDRHRYSASFEPRGPSGRTP